MTVFAPKARGEFIAAASQRRMRWRLDGRTTDKQAPLLLAMHGHGMDEDFFAGLLRDLLKLPWNILTPRAPFAAAGMSARGASWYDYDGNQERFRAELRRTNELMTTFLDTVEQEQQLTPQKRILLGFSQGGYCGSYVALHNSRRFNGMVISGARVKVEIMQDSIRAAGETGFRALLCRGKRDEAVTLQATESSLAGLRDGGVDTNLQLFNAGHSIGRTQVAAIRQWLQGF